MPRLSVANSEVVQIGNVGLYTFERTLNENHLNSEINWEFSVKDLESYLNERIDDLTILIYVFPENGTIKKFVPKEGYIEGNLMENQLNNYQVLSYNASVKGQSFSLEIEGKNHQKISLLTKILKKLDESKITTITPGFPVQGFLKDKEVLQYRFDSSKYDFKGNFLIVSYKGSSEQIHPKFDIQDIPLFIPSLFYVNGSPKNYQVYEIITKKTHNIILDLQLEDFGYSNSQSPNMRFEMKITNALTLNYLIDSFDMVYLQGNYLTNFISKYKNEVLLVKFKSTNYNLKIVVNSKKKPNYFSRIMEGRRFPVHFLDRSTLFVNNQKFSHKIEVALRGQNQTGFFFIKKITMPYYFDRFYSQMAKPKIGEEYVVTTRTQNQVVYKFKEVEYSIIPEMNFSNIHFVYHAYLAKTEEALLALEEDREIQGGHEPPLHQTIKSNCIKNQCREILYNKAAFSWTANNKQDSFFILVKAELIFEQAQTDQKELNQEPISFYYTKKQVEFK